MKQWGRISGTVDRPLALIVATVAVLTVIIGTTYAGVSYNGTRGLLRTKAADTIPRFTSRMRNPRWTAPSSTTGSSSAAWA
jgi:hypothetical protein